MSVPKVPKKLKISANDGAKKQKKKKPAKGKIPQIPKKIFAVKKQKKELKKIANKGEVESFFIQYFSQKEDTFPNLVKALVEHGCEDLDPESLFNKLEALIEEGKIERFSEGDQRLYRTI